MTSREHRLLLMLLTHQSRQIKTLTDILENKGIIQGDDLQAFRAAADFAPGISVEVLEMTAVYRRIAEFLQVAIPAEFYP